MQNVPMCLEEFVFMFTEAGLVDENFGQREIGPLFNMAMMTNVKETESDRHLNMFFLEFLEALARCADRFEIDKLEDFFPDFKSKNKYQLDKKLESVCFKLMQRFLGQKVFDSVYQKYKEHIE